MVIVSLLLLIFSHSALARKGVGVVWTTETETVDEGKSHCIEYGIYNPWDEDVTASLSVSEELKPIISKQDSDSRLIPAVTYHEDAIPLELCFKVAKVYQENCLVAGMLCEKTCSEPQVEYLGNILALEEQTGGAAGTGSATSLGVSVPLKLKVACKAHARDYTFAYALIILIALAVIARILLKKQNTNKPQEMQ